VTERTGGTASAESLRYLAQLDGIRGFAVILVVLYHLGYLTAGWGPRPFPGGFVGVDLFFALSGFLITTGLVSQLERNGRVRLGDFAVRRIRRLVPALAFAVLGVVILIPLLGGGLGKAGRNSALGSLLYVSNWQQADGQQFLLHLSHTWSLSVEAQFYLVWPLILLVVYRLRVPRAVFAGLLVATAAAIAVHRWRMWTDQAHFLPLSVRTDTRADVILLGCLGALLCAWGRIGAATGRRLRIPTIVAIGVILYVALDSETGDVRLYRGPLLSMVAVGCAVLVVAAVLDPGWWLHRCWRTGFLVFLGQRSYSLYLWHVPIFVLISEHMGTRPQWLRLLVGLPLAAAATELSYRLVENRFRHRAPSAPAQAILREST